MIDDDKFSALYWEDCDLEELNGCTIESTEPITNEYSTEKGDISMIECCDYLLYCKTSTGQEVMFDIRTDERKLYIFKAVLE